MPVSLQAINLNSKLASFSDHWSPKVVGELNGQYVKLVKFLGEYVWHHHAHEDEMFLVIDGQFDMHFRETDAAGRSADRVVTLRAGEFCIVPRGVEHKPAAASECSVMLFEPAETRNTGNVDHAYTIEAADLDRL